MFNTYDIIERTNILEIDLQILQYCQRMYCTYNTYYVYDTYKIMVHYKTINVIYLT